jgi:hypothetical protein
VRSVVVPKILDVQKDIVISRATGATEKTRSQTVAGRTSRIPRRFVVVIRAPNVLLDATFRSPELFSWS